MHVGPTSLTEIISLVYIDQDTQLYQKNQTLVKIDHLAYYSKCGVYYYAFTHTSIHIIDNVHTRTYTQYS